MSKHKPEDLVVIPKKVLDDMYRHFGGSIYLYLGETKPLKPMLIDAFKAGVIHGTDPEDYNDIAAEEEYLKKPIEI